MPAGYSGTPLVKRLGLEPGMRAAFVGAPPHYPELLGELPGDVRVLARVGAGMDFVHLFCTRASELARKLRALAPRLAQGGMGLVDVKVCAVDEDWSGLKFVIPVARRKE